MHTKKLELKKIRKEDLRSIIKWRNDSEIMKYNTQYFLLNMEYECTFVDEIPGLCEDNDYVEQTTYPVIQLEANFESDVLSTYHF